MIKFRIAAYDKGGALGFGGALYSKTVQAALVRFESLPHGARRAELSLRNKMIAARRLNAADQTAASRALLR